MRVPRKDKIYTRADEVFHLPSRLVLAGEMRNPMAQHSWTYAAINATATALSQVDLRVMSYRSSSQEEQGTPVPDTDPYQRAFNKPNRDMQRPDFTYAISVSIDLYGEALLYAVNTPDGGYDPSKPPINIWIVPRPLTWTPQYDEATNIRVGWKDQNGRPISDSQVCQIKNWNPDNPGRGLAPVAPVSLSIRTDWKAGQFNEAFLDNGADPGGTLTMEGGLSEEQESALRRKWEDRHSGPLKANRVAILKGGIRYEQLQVSQLDMQFLEGRAWSKDEILAALGVPGQEVGDIDDVNRATADVTAKKWWQNRLIPRLTKIQMALSEFFFASDTSRRVEYDTGPVEALQEDFSEKIEQALGLKTLGWDLNAINDRLDMGMPRVTVEAEEEDPEPDAPEEDEDEARTFNRPHTFQERRDYLSHMCATVYHPGERALEEALNAYYEATFKATEKKLARWASQIGVAGLSKNVIPLTATEVDRILLSFSELTNAMNEAVGPVMGTVAIAGLDSLAQEIGGFQTIQPNLNTPWLRNMISTRLGAMIQLSKSDRSKVRDALLKQIGDTGFGSIQEIRKALRREFTHLSNSRALTIARTEAGTLVNSIRFEGMRQEGIGYHEWITARDDRVRPEGKPVPPGYGNHADVDGQVVKIGDEFRNGLKYPNDPMGPAVEVINCRCVAVAVDE